MRFFLAEKARGFLRDEEGQGITEYVLVISFLALSVLGLQILFGSLLGIMYRSITSGVSKSNP